MFLGNVIREKRKAQKLTQGELAEDICGQYIISKLEKHNASPSLNVLIKLCKKLDLTLNDVFSDFSTEVVNSEEHTALVEVEHQILLATYTGDQAELTYLSKQKLSNEDEMRYLFIKGYLDITNNPLSAQFDADSLLRLTKLDTYNVYTELAYLLKGLVAEQQADNEYAEKYYGIIEAAMQANFSIPNADSMQLLFVLKTISNFYVKEAKWAAVVPLTKRAIDFAEQEASMLFLDELYYDLALAQREVAEDNQETTEIASVMARVRQNDKLLQLVEVNLAH
ncbi:helix-turn-helix domain-containing protein [Lactiplantibacillus herbarum]|uniref:helix-turn-helix domain-containing protein n=1 Tax=Lactiplantibacillus herbarum TaxID=1670446 RepID=UPI00064F822D|nr:helix-turn-helix transcriptional regulator [Lactiplantibacillus herbarum]